MPQSRFTFTTVMSSSKILKQKIKRIASKNFCNSKKLLNKCFVPDTVEIDNFQPVKSSNSDTSSTITVSEIRNVSSQIRCSNLNLNKTLVSDLNEFELDKNNNRKLFINQLRDIIVKHKLTRSATNDLLKLLKQQQNFEYFPFDARSILATPRKINIRELEPGLYSHFGLEKQLIRLLATKSFSNIRLQFNIDGIPISKSSGQQFWRY
jgi:hypothetical protein